MKIHINKVLDETKKIVTSDDTKKFVKEVIKDTATSSIKNFGWYALSILLVAIAGICSIIYLISILF